MNPTAILLVGHGSREAAANLEFEELVAGYRACQARFEVAHGYIELAPPSLADALADVAKRAPHVIVLPVMLFAAGHVKNDLPLALATARRENPTVRFDAARPLGVHPALVSLARRRAAEVPGEPGQTTVLVVGRGSSDPDANADFCKFVRLFAEGSGYARVEPCFMGVTRPLFDEALELAARARPERLLVVPYLLCAGRLVARLRERLDAFACRYPWIRTALAPHLGPDADLFTAIDERIEQTLAGAAPLPCDTCQYRVPLPGLEANVGGLKALLWSVRHTLTHTQAAPHVHAHRPLRKHVLVCVNRDCADRGSLALVTVLRRLIKAAGKQLDIKVTRTLCMGRCGEGPTVAVYPDGVWYRAVQAADAPELVHEHLLNDRLVARLVDNILQ